MALPVTKKVPAKAIKSVVTGELNVAKDGDTVKLWTKLNGKVYELSMIAQADAPASGGSGGTTDHGVLTGLSDDDHTQYALLAGRSGGQTVIGGTGTTDDLTLRTTAGVGASGANMVFQVGNNGATEAMRILNSGSVGVGTTSPTAKFEVDGSVIFNESGNAVNCRVESDGDANCLVVDGTNNTVQVGAATASDSAKFYVSGKLSTSGEAEINGDLNHDGNNVGFYGSAPVAQSTGWNHTNGTTDKTFDADATTIDEIADNIYTLVAYLKTRGDLAA